MLKPGTIAPEFTLNDQFGNPVSLADFRGKTVVLYFYSKDNLRVARRKDWGFKHGLRNLNPKTQSFSG